MLSSYKNIVLLIQGPILSIGRTYFSTPLHAYEERVLGRQTEVECATTYNAESNISELARVYKYLGARVIYSGWSSEYTKSLADNKNIDFYLLNKDELAKSQGYEHPALASRKLFINNKQKSYFSTLQGLIKARQEWGGDLTILKVRSDIFFDVSLMHKLCMLGSRKQFFVVESVPFNGGVPQWGGLGDFFCCSKIDLQVDIFEDLYNRSLSNESYNESPHADYSGAVLSQVALKKISSVITADYDLLDGLIWRGIPRSIERIVKGASFLNRDNCGKIITFSSDK